MDELNKADNLKERIVDNAQEHRENLSRNQKLVLILVSILAAMIFLAGINKPHLNPFSTKLDLDGATLFAGAATQISEEYTNKSSSDTSSGKASSSDASSSDTSSGKASSSDASSSDTSSGKASSSDASSSDTSSSASSSDYACGAIVDSQFQRLIITDENCKLLNVVDMTKSGSPFDKITSVVVRDEDIYVSGYKTHNGGEYITSESVVRYGTDGKLKETIFTKTIDDAEFVTEPSVKQIVFADASSGEVSSEDASSDSSSSDASSSDQNATLCLVTTEGEYVYLYTAEDNYEKPVYDIYVGEHVQKILRSNTLDNIVALGRSGRLYALGTGAVYTVEDLNDKSVNLLLYGLSDELSYGVSYIIRNIIHWLSIVWLAAIVLGLIVYFLFFKMNNTYKVALLAVGCIVIASVYYSSGIASTTESSYEHSIIRTAKQYSRIMSLEVEEGGFDAIKREGIVNYCRNLENKDTIDNIHNFVKEISDEGGKDVSFFVKMYIIEDGKYYTFASSDDAVCYGFDISNTEDVNIIKKNLGSDSAVKSENAVSERIASYQPIYDSEGNTIGVVAVGFKEDNLRKTQSNTCIDMFVNLLAIFIALFVAYKGFGDILTDVKNYRNDKKNGIQGAEANLAGSFNMLYKFCCSMDAAIVVYVAQSLCADVPFAQQAVLVALPSSAYSVGMMIGKLIGPVMFRRRGYRKAAVLSSAVTAASSLIIMFSISITSIMIFIAAKLVAGIFSAGVLYMAGDALPYATEDKEKRDSILASSYNTTTAAMILTAIVYGYISQYLSYAVIYLFAAILAVAMMLLCLIAFKNDAAEDMDDEETKAAKKAASKAAWSVVLKPSMIMYFVGYMIPTILFGGYNGYLFPLYSAGAGLTALLLSNLSAFSKTVNYLTFDAINDFTKQFSESTVMVGTLAIDSICLLCFLLSPNIYWAIAVLFIFSCTNGMGTLGSKLYVNDVAEENEVDINELRNNNSQVNSFMYIFQSPLLSTFVNLGINLACAAVGAVGGVLAAVFGIYNKKRRKQ